MKNFLIFWIIGQLNKLTAISQPMKVVEEKQISDFKVKIKTHNLQIFGTNLLIGELANKTHKRLFVKKSKSTNKPESLDFS